MKIYDISMEIHENMTVYKNKKEKRPKHTITVDSGDVRESRISMDMHTGAHIDAPLHMIRGVDTVENIDLNKVITKCKVFDFTNISDKITSEDLASKDIQKGDFIIFKTRNSFREDFDFEFVYLDKSGAQFLKEKGVIGVGIDALGIERNQPEHETHKILLGAGIVILEGLRLKDVEEGEYFLYAAPLKIRGAEASPTRAVLIKEE
ncbi:Kynurenine formamidase [Thermoanaerobacter thermohydrosulfuricus]|uniref:Kynurenine formamidase n=1 Tax=Thermoanaerobacter thermohydrosulfuricus TaxID=1516 RepID=A0A1G7SIL8_THETY|nr:cyclase family protein [Thermoanaerobacter thermohydrosulfuricus]SDG22926.1 Kynurenine formamidase [Thermoanaerobacter thermohydrosulfuricus]